MGPMLPILGKLIFIRTTDQKVITLRQAILLAWNRKFNWILIFIWGNLTRPFLYGFNVTL